MRAWFCQNRCRENPVVSIGPAARAKARAAIHSGPAVRLEHANTRRAAARDFEARGDPVLHGGAGGPRVQRGPDPPMDAGAAQGRETPPETAGGVAEFRAQPAAARHMEPAFRLGIVGSERSRAIRPAALFENGLGKPVAETAPSQRPAADGVNAPPCQRMAVARLVRPKTRIARRRRRAVAAARPRVDQQDVQARVGQASHSSMPPGPAPTTTASKIFIPMPSPLGLQRVARMAPERAMAPA